MIFNRSHNKRGFTLIELLVVIAIVLILAALLYPVMISARIKAKVSRVHTELRQIGMAIEMYRDDWNKASPPARTWCMQTKIEDYNELPPELYRYMAAKKFYDPFNPARTYKYVAPGWGYSNGTKTKIAMWIPADYPKCEKDCVPYTNPEKSPLKWALWSVGPGGGVNAFTAARDMQPVPKEQWRPYKPDGIIVRLSDGRKSP